MERATLTIAEAAKFLGLGVKATRQAAIQGTIPSIRVGRKILVLKAALERILQVRSERAVEAGPPSAKQIRQD